jgi:hypothetical protein
MSFFGKPTQVKRRGVGVYSATTGLYQPASVSTISIIATVQPAKSTDVMLLPEARRQVGSVVVYTKAKLNLPTEGGGQGDIVVSGGSEYEVLAVDSWQNGLLSHYKYYAARVNA